MKKIVTLILALTLVFAMSTTGVFAATGPAVPETWTGPSYDAPAGVTQLDTFGQDTSNWEYSLEHGVKMFHIPGQSDPTIGRQYKGIVWEKQAFLSIVPTGWELSSNSDQSVTEIDTKGKFGIITVNVYSNKGGRLVAVADAGGNVIYAGPVSTAPKQYDAGTVFNPESMIPQDIIDFCHYIHGF